MSITSNWPLPPSSERFLVPNATVKELRLSSLSRGLVPLAFGYYHCAENHFIRRKSPDNHLLIFCTEGRGTLNIQGIDVPVNANDMVFLPKGLSHEYRANRADPWSIYWAHVDGHMFEEFMEIIGIDLRRPTIRLNDPSQVIEEFEQLISTRQFGYQLNRFYIVSNILKKILCLVTLSRPTATQTSKKELSRDQLELFFENNVSESLTLEEMARYFGFSKFYFAKKFHELTGTSPIKFFNEIKVQQACVLLDSTDKPIKNIGKLLGYEDPYYFSRLFKATIGLSPSQYRNSRDSH